MAETGESGAGILGLRPASVRFAQPTPWLGTRTPTLVEGTIVEYENRLWRVGLVNLCRARLDPLTGSVVRPSPLSGRCFTSYGDSVNIGPTSLLPAIDPTTLDEAVKKRLARLVEMGNNIKSHIHPTLRPDVAGEDEMPEGGAVSVAPIPTRSKQARKSRAAGLAKRPKNEATPLGTKRVKAKADKPVKESRPCACGCGGMTTGYFIPGHDARFKSWLLNLERGKTALHGQELKDGQERTPLPRKVQEQYKWVRRGGGWIPTTNYKGEAHKGYDKE